MGVRVAAELLSPGLARRAETPPPLGFNFNRGANFVPCVLTNSEGRGIPACYTWGIMGPNPHIIGIIHRDRSQYGGPLYTIPDHNQGEHVTNQGIGPQRTDTESPCHIGNERMTRPFGFPTGLGPDGPWEIHAVTL